jgi:hypothetical protein
MQLNKKRQVIVAIGLMTSVTGTSLFVWDLLTFSITLTWIGVTALTISIILLVSFWKLLALKEKV